MELSPIVQSTLDVVRSKTQGDLALAVAVMTKERRIAQSQSEAILSLLESAAQLQAQLQSAPPIPNRGIDVRA